MLDGRRVAPVLARVVQGHGVAAEALPVLGRRGAVGEGLDARGEVAWSGLG